MIRYGNKHTKSGTIPTHNFERPMSRTTLISDSPPVSTTDSSLSYHSCASIGTKHSIVHKLALNTSARPMAIKPEPIDPTLSNPSAPLHPNPTSTSKAPVPTSTPELKKERDAALKALSEHRRATAWAVGRWPVEKHVVHTRTRVHLPRTYLARQGSDVRAVWPGADINQLVHRHYCEEVGKDGRRLEDGVEGVEKRGEREQDRDKREKEEREREKGREPWPNYVASERIRPRR